MFTPSQEEAKTKIQDLLETYRHLNQPELQSEANIRANFIDTNNIVFDLYGIRAQEEIELIESNLPG